MQQKKHVIVTGGAGYIGSHTIIELLEKSNYHVISIDNFSNSSEDAYHRVDKITHKKHFDKIKVDLSNFEKLSTALYHFDDIDIAGVIHFAAFKSVGDSMEDPLKYYDNNLGALVNILKVCEKKNVKNFIFSSSCSVYGDSKALPVTEDTPLQKAASPYGHTKQMGEDMLREYCSIKKDFKCIALRYFNPVGAHMSGMNGEFPIHKPTNLVPVITQTAVGKNFLAVHGSDYDTRDGTCIRDYVHVSDIADAHIKALDFISDGHKGEAYSVYNLGTGKGVSVLEAIHAFEKVSGKKLNYAMGPRRAGDVVQIYSNSEKAKKDLGWIPKYNIDDMMLSAWKWEQEL
jgi:UDP-glucose 4-epimerase